MYNNSLITLLKSFTLKEIQDFRDFLISPYFNKKKSVIKLYDIIMNEYPDFNGESISKERIYAELFTGKAYNDSNLRVLIHNLNDLAKKFTAYRNFEENQFEFDFRQLTGLMSRRQFSQLDKMVKKLLSNIETERIISDESNFLKYRLEYDYIFYLSESNFGIYEKFLDKADFEKVFSYFSAYYYIRSMRLYINILNLKLIYNRTFKAEKFEKMVSAIDKSLFTVSPVIEIYYCIIKLFNRKNDEKYYLRIKEILGNIKSALHRDDLVEIYVNLTNFCNRKISAGYKLFEKEKFELYKEETALKLYQVERQMAPVYFKNVVILALSLGEYNWIKEFIFKYKDELPKNSVENVYNYCMALYEFDMKQFEKALEYLSRIKYDELYLKYDSKILQIMIYYEMNSLEPLFSSMEAFRHFLLNNKLLPDIKKKLYLNFYKFFKKTINFSLKNDREDLELLKAEITSCEVVFNKNWIVKKIDNLISKYS